METATPKPAEQKPATNAKPAHPPVNRGFPIAIVALVIAAAHIKWPAQIDDTVIILSLLAFAPWILPVLSRYVKSIEAFGAKITLLEQKIESATRKLDDLYLLSIGGKVLKHLRKLYAPEGYGKCVVSAAVPRELGYLENLGYIEFKSPLKGLDSFLNHFNNREISNLSDHVQLTEAGRMFYELRAHSLAKQGTAPEGSREPVEQSSQ